MPAFIEAMAPIFVLVGIGAVLGYARVFDPPAAVTVLNRFVYWVALPPVLFLAPLRLSSGADILTPFLVAYGLSCLGTYALAYAAAPGGTDPRQRAIAGMAASFGNTGYLGIPLFLIVFGEDSVLPAVVATLFNSLVLIPLTTALMERGRRTGSRSVAFFGDLRRAALSPLVVASLAGIAASVLGVALPTWLWGLGDSLGAAAAPCTLIAIGLSVASHRGRMSAEPLRVAAILKIALQPLLAWAVGTSVGLDPFWLSSSVLLAAMPTGSLVFVVAQQFGIRQEAAGAAVLLTTVASLLTLPLVFLLTG